MEAWEEGLILSAYPEGTVFLAAISYRPDYMLYPLRVRLRTPDGRAACCVIKRAAAERVAGEARVLTALADLGLPAPTVLAGPVGAPDDAPTDAVIILSELPGRPLPWIDLKSLSEADLTCRLLLQGVHRLHQLTEPVLRHEIAAALPRLTLAAELEAIQQRGGVWFADPLFARAVTLLENALPQITPPLVFSNGDYNPLNFLYEGEELTGWIDFEGACFEDPLIGFAKFILWADDDYGWGTGKKVGLVERFLYAHNVSRREFAPRLVLRGLRDLQETSMEGQEDMFVHSLRQILEASLADL